MKWKEGTMFFESLEQRQLMSVNVSGVLHIDGTMNDDVIKVTANSSTVTVVNNGVSMSYAKSWVSVPSNPNIPPTKGALTGIVIHGDYGDDKIWADSTVDIPMTLAGDNGNDSLHGGAAADVIWGDFTSDDPDWVGWPRTGDDTIDGGGGNDTLYASYMGWGTINGGVGNDTIYGSQEADVVHGDAGNDFIWTYNGNDTVYGDANNDYIYTGDGEDYLSGGDGNDTLDGGAHSNTLWGGNDNDLLTASNWADTFNGGYGTDTVSYEYRGTNINVSLDDAANDGEANEKDNVSSDVENVITGSGNDIVSGSIYTNVFTTGAGNDVVRANGGNDTVNAGTGNDTVFGDAGADQLNGNDGSDLLYAGAGNDVLHGGNDRDTLIAIGGGDDKNYGDSGEDSIWEDSAVNELNDASSSEKAMGRDHRIFGFQNTANKELTGPNLTDPTIQAYDFNATYNNPTLLDNNPLFAPGGPTRDDATQRALGDCWYLATLSAEAKTNPDHIRESIVDLGDHTYAVRYWKNGTPLYYRVDNDVPTSILNGSMYYAGTGKSGAIWVPMMEKAFAMFRGGGTGSYGSLAGGFADEAFSAMGLVSTQLGSTSTAPDLGLLKGELNLGKAMVASSDSHSGVKYSPSGHVVYNHAYTVVNVDLNAKTITLRNPWGRDTDGSWQSGLDDGYIIISAQEFAANFGRVYSSWG